MPAVFGGLGGQVLFVDTEGGFQVQRLVDLAGAAVRHCSLLAEDEEQRVAMTTFTVESILSNIFLVGRVPGSVEPGSFNQLIAEGLMDWCCHGNPEAAGL